MGEKEAARPSGGQVRVVIAYCAECGYEPQTLALADALMREFAHSLSAIELVPWYDGAFEVSVDGELVHSMLREGGFPDHRTVIDAVRARLGTRVPGGRS